MAAEETRLVFPLFNTDLLLTDRPPVKHVYAATRDENLVETAAASSSGDDAVAGPCCEWSAAAKKSNSTGFSKLWRFRDLAHRSNSDGRDAFVFLNAAEKKIAAGGVKVNAGGVAGEINNVTAQQQQKKKKNNKNVTALAHERYLRSKAKDEDRRRSYLPYRPELVGFFTNVNGGLTRNVHPY
nr:DNA ligase 1-like [Ipomoea batatas]